MLSVWTLFHQEKQAQNGETSKKKKNVVDTDDDDSDSSSDDESPRSLSYRTPLLTQVRVVPQYHVTVNFMIG